MPKIDQVSVNGTIYEIVPEIAPLFSENTAYAAGDCVIKDAVLYRFIAAHAAGAWADTDAERITVGNEFADLQKMSRGVWDAVSRVTNSNIFASAGFVTDYYINASGVETYGVGFRHTGIINVIPSKSYTFTATAVDRGNGWTLRIHAYIDGVWSRQISSVSVPGSGTNITRTIQLSSSENGVVFSFVKNALVNSVFIGSGDETAIDVVARNSFLDYFKCNSADVLPSGSLNDYSGVNGIWLLSTGETYTDVPDNLTAGFLACYSVKNFTLQIFYPFTQNFIYKRRGSGNSWSAWGKIISSNNGTILETTNDTTDRTSTILSILTSQKVCILGTGVFYVNNLNMPDDTAILGLGPSTKIILLGSDTTPGYAIKLGSRCSVSKVSILGNEEDHTANADRYSKDTEYVSRHGILWQGSASSGGDTTRRANVTDCYIANFTGGGITLNNTGLNVISGINVSDVIIWHCYAGINIAFYSEFNRFSNVAASFCHYGAINNGGNNSFVNCVFSANIEGMLIDNSNNQSSNNSHGSVTNCIFDHSDQNYGIGIHLLNISHGEMFSNCQLFYSEIVIEGSKGVVFTSLNAGSGEKITIKNSIGVIFANSMFKKLPLLTLFNNQKLSISNCIAYEEDTPADVVLPAVNIIAMPEDYSGSVGETATFTVTAENVASYQWQWKYITGHDWGNTTAAGNKTNSISVEITETRLTYEYRCKMTDSNGIDVYTSPVRISST